MYICTVTALKSTAGGFTRTTSLIEQNNGVMVYTVGMLESVVLIQKPAVSVTYRIEGVPNCTAGGPKCTIDLS